MNQRDEVGTKTGTPKATEGRQGDASGLRADNVEQGKPITTRAIE